MNIIHLFQLQKDLDSTIVENRGLQGVSLFQEKKLAFRDELSELLHEWRGHKYWSANNTPVTKAVRNEGQMMEEDKEYYNPLLDEFVDALHFALSIGLERGWYKYIDSFIVRTNKGHTKTEIIDVFNDLYENKLWSAANYMTLINDLAYLGAALGFTADEIYQAYIEKNKINHERQASNY
ncbi:dUTP diphosphatase [Bacillus pseudomycoides]|uniref:dUTP diphosphatase n=1 Tax=Bacillus bingmayongensis TaxID=1150157 RepID=A0ABU5JYQ9_9BACI|nr:dUTP diphosphatase [Bacillus pseudomycoides]